jgi:hypothetical protein
VEVVIEVAAGRSPGEDRGPEKSRQRSRGRWYRYGLVSWNRDSVGEGEAMW